MVLGAVEWYWIRVVVGESGAGKTVLSRFVAWMNGLSVFQVKVSKRYTIENFDEDLRALLKRAGCEGEKICFIFDESNVLSSAFLERMNALLASGEVPGLFEQDEFSQLMTACRESCRRDGVLIDTEEEMFRRFTREVQRNLHVVFTIELRLLRHSSIVALWIGLEIGVTRY